MSKLEPARVETDLLGFVRREVFAPQLNVTLETDLVLAGFDSMSLVRLLLFVEQTYGSWVPEQEITGEALKDLRSLAATVCRVVNSGR